MPNFYLCWLQSIISFGNSKLAAEAGNLLDGFCGQYVRDAELLIRHAGHRMSGQVLVEAVQGALPRNNAITVRPSLLPPAAERHWNLQAKIG